MSSINEFPYNMQNMKKAEAKPFVPYGCVRNFFTTHQDAQEHHAYDIAQCFLTQALATARLLIDNGEDIAGFRFNHEVIIDAISGIETQIEMALKALEHQPKGDAV
ncbi:MULTISPECIES: hypothetical protein [unclassified Acinetobacter]|uniref:hypothetical protein n=1 Tax=unclassified Acinetobacter TaxID=196816 RepID=UPI00244C1C2B|nr:MULTISPECIES: hypothetical protein [unclassified Acinetobacter]MDH0031330.1 hypothetical protein [Acinetobacter sp. GD04021]MDH0887185.1 hypothetical protein [Acinetobacter sp. GD03873]MDH1083526.1 hypothetical protein [Acinetobacter sp. GD03983]MDH2190501.1 hypothetical protein [Acinetobacter sp. GD03645]MDH2204053.1 hypothetical protein [Acinetobacter sp. GD03647]